MTPKLLEVGLWSEDDFFMYISFYCLDLLLRHKFDNKFLNKKENNNTHTKGSS